MAKKPKGHKRGCKCPFCKRAKKHKRPKKAATKRTAKRTAKRRATHYSSSHSGGTTFLAGFHDGSRDVHSKKPRRRTAGRKDPYSKGYRAGVSEALRIKKKHH